MPSRLTLLTSALLVLLPALAALQYLWVGQLSDAERERMQRTMRHAAQQFREAFDGEIGRAFMSLQVDGSNVREQAWDRYAERHAGWAGTTEHAALVADIFVIDADRGTIRLRRWNGAERRFEAAEWTGPLARVREHFTAELQAFNAAGRSGAHRPVRMIGDESLLVAPVVNIQVGSERPHQTHASVATMFGFTVIQLNLSYLKEELVPALARRYFANTDGAGYRVAVTDARDPRTVIYRSSPEAPTDPARADLTEPLFDAHGPAIMFLARGTVARQMRDTRNVVVSVIREKGEANVTTRMFDREPGAWRLLVQDDRGSLDAAVAAVRQRNLLISFGILLLMGVSIALLTISSRRAQRLARQQMEFVAGVSHELRTPVAVIRSAAENLSHGVVGDPTRVRTYGDAIQVEARRLGEMIERVLHFAGIESGRPVARTPVSLATIVDAALEATVSADERITVERHVASELPPIVGDAEALRSAVENLLTNAVKYGGADRWVGVRVEPHHRGRAREVRITVEDHGRGIAAADLPHIFEPFYRGADVIARQIQGSGLGLALVRRIVEAHGGRVTVMSREDAGSAFTIHLPIFRVKTEATQVLNEVVAR